LKFIGPFSLLEQEYFDILLNTAWVRWMLISVLKPMVTCLFTKVGSQFNHARNDLDALIVNTEVKGFLDWKKHDRMGC
jgi:hypothetical protein